MSAVAAGNVLKFMKTGLVAAVIGIGSMISLPALATAIPWTVSASFEDGGTLSGTFTYDTNQVTALTLTSSGGSLAGYTYTFGDSIFEFEDPDLIVLYSIFWGGNPNGRYLEVGSQNNLIDFFNAGESGTTFAVDIFEQIAPGIYRDGVGIVTTGQAPEPGGIALLGLGFAALAFSRRRKQKAA